MTLHRLRPFVWAGVGLAAGLLVFSFRLEGQTRSGASADKVQVQAPASKPDAAGNQVVVVNLTIDDGWYIYANPVNNPKVSANETILTVTSKDKLEAVRIEYPPGKLKEAFGEEFKIYEGTVAVRALVRRAPGSSNPLEVALQVNACNKNQCLSKGAINLTVP